MGNPRAIALALLCAAVLLSGCITHHPRQDVYSEDGIEVFLRSDMRLLSEVSKEYDHPKTISAVRLAHILSRIDMRKSVKAGNQRAPAIPTDVLYPIAEGMSAALNRANANQEVVVMAIREKRTFTIVRSEYLTSLVSYVRDDTLFVHISRVEDLLETDTYRPDKKVPQPRLSDEPERFRLYGGKGMTLLGNNALAIAWRDPIFRNPTRTKILPSGEVKRKTILLESTDEDLGDPTVFEEPERAQVPQNLSPGQLRALADLEEERLAGQITETEYEARRQQIVQSE